MKPLVIIAFTLMSFVSFGQDSLVIVHNNGNTMAVRTKPDVDAPIVWLATSGDTVKILKGDVSDYVRVQKNRSTEIGYIHQMFFSWDLKATEIINKSARNKLTFAPSPRKVKAKSTTSTRRSSSSGNSNKAIQTGPRGGRYYINSKGNKVYVK